jgi:L-2-hydroxyglutarate oxidase LhgO
MIGRDPADHKRAMRLTRERRSARRAAALFDGALSPRARALVYRGAVDRSFDAIVIGAGIVGLACAARLCRGARVLVLERHPRVALENSSRNSGVIHAGLHHPSEWLRTRLCLRGRELLVRRLKRDELPHAITGKLIVAEDASGVAELEALSARADDRGIATALLDAREVTALEPQVIAHAALLVKPTGVVRTSALVRAIEAELTDAGALVLLGAEVIGLAPRAGVIEVAIDGHRFEAPRVVMSAGLGTDALLTAMGLDVGALGLRQHYVRGTWLALPEAHRKAIARLVYPLPEKDGLGVHLTRDVDGYLLAGPDAEWVDTPDFVLAAGKEEPFAERLARYFRPRLDPTTLHPCSVGVRTRLSAPSEPPRDFAIADASLHGVAGLVALAGIESPGLTAALAIAEEVEARLRAHA